MNLQGPFGFSMIIDTLAQSGQQICFVVDVTPSADLNPANNTYQQCYNVVNSFDPNDKLANPPGNFESTQEWITYTIRFQNTGTAPAEHIYILDTLDTDLDESTFEFLQSSHEVNVHVTGSAVRFNFPYINLPDSVSDEPGSHGYVQYRVKPDNGLAIGAVIENTAAIYFDFNPPVITNTTINTVVAPTTIAEPEPELIGIYPNPTNGMVIIKSGAELNYIRISDITGRTLFEQSASGNILMLDLTKFNSGLYFVHTEHSKGKELSKIIVR
jgi:hypothetical protein